VDDFEVLIEKIPCVSSDLPKNWQGEGLQILIDELWLPMLCEFKFVFVYMIEN